MLNDTLRNLALARIKVLEKEVPELKEKSDKIKFQAESILLEYGNRYSELMELIDYVNGKSQDQLSPEAQKEHDKFCEELNKTKPKSGDRERILGKCARAEFPLEVDCKGCPHDGECD